MRAVFSLFAALFPLGVLATSGGYTGASGLGGNTCNSCHRGGAVPTVTLSGPTALQAGQVGRFRLVITGGAAVRGGFNIAVDNANAALRRAATGSNVDRTGELGNELYQTARIPFQNGSLAVDFEMVAPQLNGTVTIYAAGNSCGDPSGVDGDRAGTDTHPVTVSGATGTGAAPTIATPATAPGLVRGVNANVSVLGADDQGEGTLRYTWRVQSGPAPVTFSPNGTNAAKQTVARFGQAGVYVFAVDVSDGGGIATSTTSSVTVEQMLSGLVVSPATATVEINRSKQFTAEARDQFDAAMPPPTTGWTVNGGGAVSNTGLFKAGANVGGPFQVAAHALGLSATAEVRVVGVGEAPVSEVDAPVGEGNSMETLNQTVTGGCHAAAGPVCLGGVVVALLWRGRRRRG